MNLLDEQKELMPYFDMVKNSEHWKNPINKTLRANGETRDKISRAIPYFTGTHATWEDMGNGFWKVTADGYFLGPCN